MANGDLSSLFPIDVAKELDGHDPSGGSSALVVEQPSTPKHDVAFSRCLDRVLAPSSGLLNASRAFGRRLWAALEALEKGQPTPKQEASHAPLALSPPLPGTYWSALRTDTEAIVLAVAQTLPAAQRVEWVRHRVKRQIKHAIWTTLYEEGADMTDPATRAQIAALQAFCSECMLEPDRFPALVQSYLLLTAHAAEVRIDVVAANGDITTYAPQAVLTGTTLPIVTLAISEDQYFVALPAVQKTDLVWLNADDMDRIAAFFPAAHRKWSERDLRALSGMAHVRCNGLKWAEMPEVYGPYKTIYSRWKRWRDAGVFDRMLDDIRSIRDDRIAQVLRALSA